jgi:hypothetical protein
VNAIAPARIPQVGRYSRAGQLDVGGVERHCVENAQHPAGVLVDVAVLNTRVLLTVLVHQAAGLNQPIPSFVGEKEGLAKQTKTKKPRF